MSKTVSSRLPKEIHERLHECCNNKGITINDFVKEAVETKLNGSDLTNNQFQNCTECSDDAHEIYKKVMESIHDADGTFYDDDSKGRPLRFSAEWTYDEQK